MTVAGARAIPLSARLAKVRWEESISIQKYFYKAIGISGP